MVELKYVDIKWFKQTRIHILLLTVHRRSKFKDKFIKTMKEQIIISLQSTSKQMNLMCIWTDIVDGEK